MAFDPIVDPEGKEVNLKDILTEAATELMVERKRDASNLIKGFLTKVEQLSREIKSLENQLKSKQESLTKTQEKIERLRTGDWKVLSENSGSSNPDSTKKEEK